MVTWRRGICWQLLLLGASADATIRHSCYRLHSGMIQTSPDSCSTNIWDSFSHCQAWIHLSQRDSHQERSGFQERWLTFQIFWSRRLRIHIGKIQNKHSGLEIVRVYSKDIKHKTTSLTDQVRGHSKQWSWSLGEYSLVFEDPRTGRLPLVVPAPICHLSHVSQVEIISWCGRTTLWCGSTTMWNR